MTFTLTYKTLHNPDFLAGMQKLARFDGWKDPKKAYNAARMSALIDLEMKTMREVRGKLIGAQPKVEAGKGPTEDEKAAMLKAAQDFSAVEVTIERHKVDLKDCEGVRLTPLEILALEPLLEGLE